MTWNKLAETWFCKKNLPVFLKRIPVTRKGDAKVRCLILKKCPDFFKCFSLVAFPEVTRRCLVSTPAKKGHLFRNLRHFYGFESAQLTGLLSCEMLDITLPGLQLPIQSSTDETSPKCISTHAGSMCQSHIWRASWWHQTPLCEQWHLAFRGA